MLMNLYAVRDEKMRAFRFYHFLPYREDKGAAVHGEAARNFGLAVNNPKTEFFSHPADYSLYLVGQLDDEDGRVSDISPKELIARGSEFPRVSNVNQEVSQ